MKAVFVPCFRQLLKGELTVSLAGFLRTSSALCLTIGPSLLRPIIESPATGALLPQHANNRHPPPQRERFSQSIISFLSSFPSRNVRVPARCARILDFQPSWVPALRRLPVPEASGSTPATSFPAHLARCRASDRDPVRPRQRPNGCA